eukprot:SM000177S03176  [mRNA]  locus=s177:19517:24438:- [translate_table: standard]
MPEDESQRRRVKKAAAEASPAGNGATPREAGKQRREEASKLRKRGKPTQADGMPAVAPGRDKETRPGEPKKDEKKRKKKRLQAMEDPGTDRTAEAADLDEHANDDMQALPTGRHSPDGVSQAAAAQRKGRLYTVSIALPGSVIDNAQSLELATVLAGQLARAAAIFQVDEIVVFDDGDHGPSRPRRWRTEGDESTGGAFLARVLQYLETPQYLRKTLIPMHKDLRFAGLLPPLDAPHQPRANEWCSYREGVVLEAPAGKARQKQGGCAVDVGLYQEVRLNEKVPAGLRVTVAMGANRELLTSGALLSAVPPSEPREQEGLYWGYTVRLTRGLSEVLTGCPFGGEYDYTIGTSEHGEQVKQVDLVLPAFKHLLVVFGSLAGLEESAELDDALEVKEASCLFDRYLNTCPGQGSRTIRTEEACLISLSFLQPAIQKATAVLLTGVATQAFQWSRRCLSFRPVFGARYEILRASIVADARRSIYFDAFGFGRRGHLDITLSNVKIGKLDVTETTIDTERALMGFYAVSELRDGASLMANESCLFPPGSPFERLFTMQMALDETNVNGSYHYGRDVAAPAMLRIVFINCQYQQAQVTNMDVELRLFNVLAGGRRDYLPAGKTQLPALYLAFFIAYATALGVWLWVCHGARESVHRIHILMAVLILVKALTVLSLAGEYSRVKATGVPHGWNIAYYIFSFFRGVMLFMVIVLIGTGWSFLKPFLQDREKKIIMIVIPLQVFANLAYVIFDEEGMSSVEWTSWSNIFHILDIICCCAILFPIVWSIQQLREASRTDGKAAKNLAKLTLFRQFYIMVVCYIYFTRIIVYLLQNTLPYQNIWLAFLAGELATLAFYSVTGYNFKPLKQNPYFILDDEEEEAAKQLALQDEEFDL